MHYNIYLTINNGCCLLRFWNFIMNCSLRSQVWSTHIIIHAKKQTITHPRQIMSMMLIHGDPQKTLNGKVVSNMNLSRRKYIIKASIILDKAINWYTYYFFYFLSYIYNMHPLHCKQFTPYNILKMHCTCTIHALYKLLIN